MIKLGEVKSIIVDLEYPDFTRALVNAHRQAAYAVGMDDCGYMTKVVGNQRSADTLHVKFTGVELIGSSWVFQFDVWVTREKDK